jgi:hypothetical protein
MKAYAGRLVRPAFLSLSIVVAGVAVARLGVEVVLFGSLLLVEMLVDRPLGASVVLAMCVAVLSGSVALKAYSSAARVARIAAALFAGTVSLLFVQVALLGLLTLEQSGFYNWASLRERLWMHPVLGTLNVLLFAAASIVVVAIDSRRFLTVALRVAAALGVMAAWLLAMELLWAGMIDVAVQGLGSWEMRFEVVGGILVIAVCAAAVRRLFRLHARRLTVFVGHVAAMALVLLDNASMFIPG